MDRSGGNFDENHKQGGEKDSKPHLKRRLRKRHKRMDIAEIADELGGSDTQMELGHLPIPAFDDVSWEKVEVTESKLDKDVITGSVTVLKEMGRVLNSKAAKGDTSFTASSGESLRAASDEDSIFARSDVSDPSMGAETSLVLFFQILLPFITAGIGMVFAGLVLDVVQHWNLFIQVPETFILVPALLGLKGNLEMTFVSRLSTLANMGHMDATESRWIVIIANLALIQVQAIVVAFLASGFAVVLAWIPKGQVDWSHAALLCASSLTTASLASLLLSTVMICVVLCSRNFHINPDNVATPIAASLGDLTTLGVLSLLGSIFLRAHLEESWLNVAVILTFMVAAPFWAYVARRDEGAVDVLENGWSPIIFSMLISSTGGFILEGAIKRFPKIAVFQPVINGVGGNLAAIQASRMATFFHRNYSIGCLSGKDLTDYFSIKRAFFSNDCDARAARVLLSLVAPCHFFFNWIIQILHKGSSPPSGPLFTGTYILAALIQVLLLLYVCQLLVAFMWSMQVDPDCAAIPYLTALGDLCGTFLLFVIFVFLTWFNKGQNFR